MNYLSFDVGIKNLAYCILTPENKIIDWNIINLNKNPLCQVNLRKQCQNQASYKIINEDLEYCCSSHKKKFKKVKKLNNDKDLLQLTQICLHELQLINTKGVGIVLIENQPALKNPTMKSVQMMIYTFFILRGVMNDNSSITKVHMVNARNKLKIYKGTSSEMDAISCACPFNDEKKNKYKINKYLSIEYTKKMIENEDDKFKELFQESKKKDDLADSYLQGVYWINK